MGGYVAGFNLSETSSDYPDTCSKFLALYTDFQFIPNKLIHGSFVAKT